MLYSSLDRRELRTRQVPCYKEAYHQYKVKSSYSKSANQQIEQPGAERAARAALVDRSACIVVTRAQAKGR